MFEDDKSSGIAKTPVPTMTPREIKGDEPRRTHSQIKMTKQEPHLTTKQIRTFSQTG